MQSHPSQLWLLALVAWLAWASRVSAQDSERPRLAPNTGLEMSVGLRYQGGTTSHDDLRTVPSGALFALEVFGHHEQLWAGRLWRAELELGTDTYTRQHSDDYDIVSLRVGRVFEPRGGWRVYTALAGDHAMVGYAPFYTGGSFWLAAEPTTPQTLRWLHARLGREEFSSGYRGSDAWVMDCEVGLGADELRVAGASVWIGPAVRYNHAQSSQLRYGQLELATEYWMPLFGSWSISVDAEAWRRLYAGHREGSDDNRRDWYLATGSSMWFEGLFAESLSLELRYEYERNWSDDRLERYESHNPGVYLHWVY